jgi:hypothetical protein
MPSAPKRPPPQNKSPKTGTRRVSWEIDNRCYKARCQMPDRRSSVNAMCYLNLSVFDCCIQYDGFWKHEIRGGLHYHRRQSPRRHSSHRTVTEVR